jgi:hypothetical protein
MNCPVAESIDTHRKKFEYLNGSRLRIVNELSFNDQQNLLNEVRFFIKQRQNLMAVSSEAMERSRGLVNLIFSHNAKVPINKRHSTREVISGVLLQLPSPMQRIWSDAIHNNRNQFNQIRKAFCWAFKSLVSVDSKNQIAIKDRSLKMPYAVHTHVDVPYAIACIIRGVPDSLTLAVSCTHDSKEEGKFIVWDEIERTAIACDFDASKLKGIFPNDNLGTRLAISIPTLTESTFDEMKSYCDVPKLIKKVNAILEEAGESIVSEDNLKYHKFYVKDPLVFGGLALQIQSVVENLLVGPNKDEDLAFSIVITEIADRISDVSSLEYYFNYQSEFGPQAARRRVMCLYGRIHNMLDKLSQTQQLFESADKKNLIDNGLKFLQALLEEKIDILKDLFPEVPLAKITKEQLAEHQNLLNLIQPIVDSHMKPFVENKSQNIFEEAYSWSAQ